MFLFAFVCYICPPYSFLLLSVAFSTLPIFCLPSSYSTNIHEVNVTIAGTVCDVQLTNITHIICVTNAQRKSQETKVRVGIRDQGIAKLVRQQPNFSLSHKQNINKLITVFGLILYCHL